MASVALAASLGSTPTTDDDTSLQQLSLMVATPLPQRAARDRHRRHGTATAATATAGVYDATSTMIEPILRPSVVASASLSIPQTDVLPQRPARERRIRAAESTVTATVAVDTPTPTMIEPSFLLSVVAVPVRRVPIVAPTMYNDIYDENNDDNETHRYLGDHEVTQCDQHLRVHIIGLTSSPSWRDIQAAISSYHGINSNTNTDVSVAQYWHQRREAHQRDSSWRPYRYTFEQTGRYYASDELHRRGYSPNGRWCLYQLVTTIAEDMKPHDETIQYLLVSLSDVDESEAKRLYHHYQRQLHDRVNDEINTIIDNGNRNGDGTNKVKVELHDETTVKHRSSPAYGIKCKGIGLALAGHVLAATPVHRRMAMLPLYPLPNTKKKTSRARGVAALVSDLANLQLPLPSHDDDIAAGEQHKLQYAASRLRHHDGYYNNDIGWTLRHHDYHIKRMIHECTPSWHCAPYCMDEHNIGTDVMWHPDYPCTLITVYSSNTFESFDDVRRKPVVRYVPLPSRDVDSVYWKYAISSSISIITPMFIDPLIDIIFDYFDT